MPISVPSLCSIVSILVLAQAVPAQSPPDWTAKLDEIASKLRDENRIPAVAFSVHHAGRLVHAGAHGTIDLEHDVDATVDDWYRIGAVTMTLTATAVLKLDEAGKLSIEDPISKHLPDLPEAWRAITLRQLLNHTSGLPNYTTLPPWRDRIREDLEPGDVLDILKDAPLVFGAGTRWAFNPTGYYLLGLVVEQASGEKYATYLTKRVLDPTSKGGIVYDDHRRILRGRVRGYEVVQGRRRRADFVSMEAPFAAAGLLGRMPALGAFVHALTRGEILDADRLDTMTTRVVLKNGQEVDYGMGLALGELRGMKVWAHQGFVAGFSAQILHQPEAELTIAVAGNVSSQMIGRLAVDLVRESRVGLGLDAAPKPRGPLEFLRGAWQVGERKFELRPAAFGLEIVFPGLGAVSLKTVREGYYAAEGGGVPSVELRRVDGAAERVPFVDLGEGHKRATPVDR